MKNDMIPPASSATTLTITKEQIDKRKEVEHENIYQSFYVPDMIPVDTLAPTDRTFLHSGDMGDIIISLYVIKHFGGGVLYLDTTGGLNTGEYKDIISGQTHKKGLKFNKRLFEFIKPLLESQSYIFEVKEYNGESVTYDLNKFRHVIASRDGFHKTQGGNLMYSNLVAWDINDDSWKNGWIEVGEGIKTDRTTLIGRSTRYQGGHIFLRGMSPALSNLAYFIGTEFERTVINDALESDIPLYDCKDALEMARLIKEASVLISNSTFTFWLALALGHKNIWHECTNALFASTFTDLPNVKNFLGNGFIKPPEKK